MNQYRVLVLTRWFPTPEEPAQGTFVHDWSRLAARIAEVTVLHLSPGGPGPLERSRGVTEAEFDTYRLPIAWQGARSPLSHLRDARAAGSVIAEFHRERDFDLIHAHAYPAATAARVGAHRCRIPYVVTEHFTRLIRGDDRWYHRLEARYAFGRAAAVTAVGPPLGSAVERLARGPVTVIPNPVPGDFTPAPPKEEGPPFQLLSVGRLERIKGLDVALEALARLVEQIDVHWVIVGEGNERGSLESRARRLGIRDYVDFAAPVSRPEIHRLMTSSHAIVVPSRTETFSVVAAEALMTGRPVVVTRCGGPESFVGEAHGRVVDIDDPPGLADAIEDVLVHLDRFPPERLAADAQRSFSEKVVTLQLERVYEQALTPRRHS